MTKLAENYPQGTANIADDRVLSPVVIEALQNDKHLKALYSKLNKLHSMAIPKVIQTSKHEIKVTYGDEFNELVTKFHQEINFRQEQIVSFYNRR